jgi:hypothetical protein
MDDRELATSDLKHWKLWTLLIYVLICAALLGIRWQNVDWMILSDTDDNMRLAQVRALIDGQGWFDLRQYKLNPPIGADIHWSRLVDLPMAAIMLIVDPLFGRGVGNRAAIALAPMIPLALALFSVAVTARRLVAPASFAFAIVMLLASSSTMNMMMPTRIDHHGWQLALIAATIAGLTDPRKHRGGAIVGISTAASLVIGLEMLPYLAIAGAAVALRWIWDAHEAPRLRAYAATLGGGTAVGFLAFASIANRAPRCDALSPVWLSVMVLAGALLLILSFVRVERRITRFAVAALAAGLIMGAIAMFWPHCLGRPEGISPELERLWFKNIREVKPLYTQKLAILISTMFLPIVGAIGAAREVRRAATPAKLGAWVTVAFLSVSSIALTFWQTRAGPAAQLLAIPGATALAWAIIPALSRSSSILVRTGGVVAAFLAVSGLGAQILVSQLPIDVPTPQLRKINAANAACVAMSQLSPVARRPSTTIFTHVDLAPRLIAVTHHKAIAGPYHRNGDAIIDVHHFFGGSADRARAIARKYGATHLLVCPDMSETTIYRTRDKTGFYVQLMKGQVPAWLEPVSLPKGSPLRLWRIVER